MTLLKELTATVEKNMTGKFAKELAAKFELDEAEVVAFVKEYLGSHSSGHKKGLDGKAAKNGYLVFSTEKRAEIKENNPDAQPKEIMGLLASAWKELSDEEKNVYNAQAKQLNAENGLGASAEKTPTTPSKGKGTPATTPAKGGKAAPATTPAKGGKAAPATTPAKGGKGAKAPPSKKPEPEESDEDDDF
jgi:hypothetical protein